MLPSNKEMQIFVKLKTPLNQRTQVRLNRGVYSCLDLHFILISMLIGFIDKLCIFQSIYQPPVRSQAPLHALFQEVFA